MDINKSLVEHFMTEQIFYVKADDILDQAEKLFHDHQLSTAPVLIDKKNVIGVITDFQLIRFFLMRNAKPARARIGDFQDELEPVVLVEKDQPIETAFRLMVQSPSHRLYVTDKGKLVGVLSPKDLLPFLAGDVAIERYKEDKDLIAARVRIKSLFNELTRAKSELGNYRQVFNASPYMIHSVDLDGNITMANPMLHSVLGYEDGELIGKSILDLYSEQFHQQAKQGLAQIKDHGYHPLINTLMVKRNKELLQVDIATTAKYNNSGVIIGTVTVGKISDSDKMLAALAHIAEGHHTMTE